MAGLLIVPMTCWNLEGLHAAAEIQQNVIQDIFCLSLQFFSSYLVGYDCIAHGHLLILLFFPTNAGQFYTVPWPI